MSELIEKVAKAIVLSAKWDAYFALPWYRRWFTPIPHNTPRDTAKAAIAVVLNDMYDHTWDNISLREYARENGVSLDD